MGHKRRIQNKNFDCGHSGLGTYCHLCSDLNKDRLVKTKQGKYLPPNKVGSQDII